MTDLLEHVNKQPGSSIKRTKVIQIQSWLVVEQYVDGCISIWTEVLHSINCVTLSKENFQKIKDLL